MKRITKTAYTSDSGRELVVLKGKCATVSAYEVDANTLRELSAACAAAAEELEAMEEPEELAEVKWSRITSHWPPGASQPKPGIL